METIAPRQAVFAGVLLLANRMQTRYDSALGEVTLKQWLALAVVSNLPQPVPSTAVVARALGTTHQNVTKLVNALAAKGLVTLEPSEEDRRARQLRLTPAAYAYLQRNAETGERLLDELLGTVPEEDLSATIRVLNHMSHTLTGEGILPPAREV